MSSWILLRRPLLHALVAGCGISLITRGHLTLWLVFSSAVAWSFVPLIEVGSLAVVFRFSRSSIPFSRAVDLFLAGDRLMMLWIVASGLLWSFVTDFLPMPLFWGWTGSFVLVLIRSCFLDQRFFKEEAASLHPVRDLALHRAVSWVLILLVFGGASLWPGILEQAGL